MRSFLRAKKNGSEVFAYIPDWLSERLQARAKRRGARPFVGVSDRLETVTDMWRRKIGKVFDLAGAFEERPTPHRFRHTFARILLQRGVRLPMLRTFERQARVTKILKDAFDDKPRPTLVAIPGGRT